MEKLTRLGQIAEELIVEVEGRDFTGHALGRLVRRFDDQGNVQDLPVERLTVPDHVVAAEFFAVISDNGDDGLPSVPHSLDLVEQSADGEVHALHRSAVLRAETRGRLGGERRSRVIGSPPRLPIGVGRLHESSAAAGPLDVVRRVRIHVIQGQEIRSVRALDGARAFAVTSDAFIQSGGAKNVGSHPARSSARDSSVAKPERHGTQCAET